MEAETAYAIYRGSLPNPVTLPHWLDLTEDMREAIEVVRQMALDHVETKLTAVE